MVEDGNVCHKIDYVKKLEIPNLEGHLHSITGSKVTAISWNVLILPIGGASVLEGLRSLGLPRLVKVIAFVFV